MPYKKIIISFLLLVLTMLHTTYASNSKSENLRLLTEEKENIEHVQFYLSEDKNAKKVFVDLVIDEGWYIYADKKSDAGYPIKVNINGINNLSSYRIIFPDPTVASSNYFQKESISYVYKNKARIILELEPINLKIPTNIEIDIEYGACKDVCMVLNKKLEYIFNSELSDDSKSDWLVELLLMIALSFLGGLILNFMPCVLPVLSIKIFSIIKSKQLDNDITKTNLLFTIIGIMSTFMTLAAIVFSLKRLGVSVGWGMHFHEPIFLMVLVIVILFAANSLWGYFEINLRFLDKFFSKLTHLSEKNSGYLGSFASGVLTTILATPCTAPFISTSVAFAITQAPYMIFIIYLGIGLGMASPYILMMIAPNILKIFPKPGAWMTRVKKVAALILLFTAMWLLYSLYNQLTLKSFLLFIVLIVIGKTFLLYIKNKKYLLIFIALSFIITVAVVVMVNKFESQKNSELDSMWKIYDSNELKSYLKDDRIVILDVTASWCINCQYNKYAVFNQQSIIDFLRKHKVILMQADYTKKSEELMKLMQGFNRFGIPLDVVYCSKNPSGILLPEILSQRDIISSVRECLN